VISCLVVSQSSQGPEQSTKIVEHQPQAKIWPMQEQIVFLPHQRRFVDIVDESDLARAADIDLKFVAQFGAEMDTLGQPPVDPEPQDRAEARQNGALVGLPE
jgi:hypothetical protein